MLCHASPLYVPPILSRKQDVDLIKSAMVETCRAHYQKADIVTSLALASPTVHRVRHPSVNLGLGAGWEREPILLDFRTNVQ